MTDSTSTTPAARATALRQAPTAPVLNDTIRAQLAHRTIRAYSTEPVSQEVMDTLVEVARASATSGYQQHMSLIRVTDPALREEICAVSGQSYVGGSAGELVFFIVDLHRNAVLRERAGADTEPVTRTNLFLQGVEDVVIAAQNVVVAAESLGLGTTYLGSILADPRRMIELLGLPRHTFPLLGLLVGHPAQDPQYKPRLPRTITVGENTYPRVEDHDADLAAYDASVREYYDLRDANNRVDSFSSQIARMLGKGAASESPVLDVLHEQGLCLK